MGNPLMEHHRDAAPPFHRLAGQALRIATTAFRRLPALVAYALADAAALGVAVYALWHERRVAPQGRGVFRNQRIVFREQLTRRRSLELLWAWARHTAHLAVDFSRMPDIRAESIDDRVDWTELKPLLEIIESGGGLLCVSGHLGFWELCGHVASVLGAPVTIVARPLRIAPVEAAVNEIRRVGGQRVLSKWGVLWPLKKALERGEPVGFLADEDVRDHPLFVPFLGTEAASSPAAAFLHRVTGAPLAVVSCHRIGRERYRFHVWDVIRHTSTTNRDADLLAITTAVNAALSRALLSYPEQWLWGSRRFLSRPPGERAGPDGLPPRA